MRIRKSTARKALRRMEDRVLAAAGRAAIRRKTATMTAVTRKAVRAAAIAAGMAAASVVWKEAQKLRKA